MKNDEKRVEKEIRKLLEKNGVKKNTAKKWASKAPGIGEEIVIQSGVKLTTDLTEEVIVRGYALSYECGKKVTKKILSIFKKEGDE